MTTSNTSLSASFTFDKCAFLHSKLDEVLRLWYRGSGQSSFLFSVDNGSPSFKVNLETDFDDGSGSEPQNPHYQPLRLVKRRRGPAKQAKNRQRAAAYQAANAAASSARLDVTPAGHRAGYSASQPPATPDYKFPGEGKPVGTGPGPSLPLPPPKGTVFPVPNVPKSSPSMTTSVTSGSTLTVATITAAASSYPMHVVNSPLICRDEILSDSDVDEAEEETSCARCLLPFDSSNLSTEYSVAGCPYCHKCYHRICGPGHQCLTFQFK